MESRPEAQEGESLAGRADAAEGLQESYGALEQAWRGRQSPAEPAVAVLRDPSGGADTGSLLAGVETVTSSDVG